VMARQGFFDPRVFRNARLAAGMTQHELARQLGVAGGERVSRWELGRSTPRSETLMRAADVLGVDPAELVGGRGESPTLRSLRRSRGLTLSELAREIHVSKSTVSRWESGRSTQALPDATVERLARVLDVSSSVVLAAIARGTD
jgi:transcriptional regulator with XRE-family HTH domain